MQEGGGSWPKNRSLWLFDILSRPDRILHIVRPIKRGQLMPLGWKVMTRNRLLLTPGEMLWLYTLKSCTDHILLCET